MPQLVLNHFSAGFGQHCGKVVVEVLKNRNSLEGFGKQVPDNW